MVESSRERSTGTWEALRLAAAGSGPRAYLVTSYSTASSPSTPSTRTFPAPLATRTRGSGPESTASLVTLVPESSSPRDLHTSRAATVRSASSRRAKSASRGETRRDALSRRAALGVRPGSRRGSSSPPRLTRRARDGRPRGPSRSRAAVDVVQADDVFLVEVAEGDLEYPHRTSPVRRREPVYRLAGDKELFLGRRVEHLAVQLHAGAGVQHHPQLVALAVVLATEGAARGDRDDLHRTRQVVGVLLEPAPGSLYRYRRRPMLQRNPLTRARGQFRPSWDSRQQWAAGPRPGA